MRGVRTVHSGEEDRAQSIQVRGVSTAQTIQVRRIGHNPFRYAGNDKSP